MTGEEAAKAIYDGVNAMFADHATVEPDECSAYVRRMLASGEPTHFIFVSFRSGRVKDEGRFEAEGWLEDRAEEVRLALITVAERFPDHAAQRVLWRKEPLFESFDATKASRKYGLKAQPARAGTYFRLVAIPLDARRLTQAERDE